MKCVVCKGSDIRLKPGEEEIRTGSDIVLVPVEVLTCFSCGERYYDRKTLRQIEEIKLKLDGHNLEVEEVGKVLRTRAA